MATIREKGPYQWQVQIRRKGWPYQHATFRTKKDAEAWARKAEHAMDRGLFADQSAGRATTLRDLVEVYLSEVSAQRPSEHSRVAETARLKRLLREEPALCSYAAVNLKPEYFEDYRDRRLKHRLKNGKTIKPGTVKRELTTLKRVIDYRTETRSVVPAVEEIFGFAELPVVSFNDLYAGKLCAALDRQHPRDLSDRSVRANYSTLSAACSNPHRRLP